MRWNLEVRKNELACPIYLTVSVYFFLNSLARKRSRAATIEGVCGSGALMPSFRPASSMAREVLLPNAPMTVPFCLKAGRLSKRLFTPLGVKKQITSYSLLLSNSFTSLLAVRYIKAREKSQVLDFSQ